MSAVVLETDVLGQASQSKYQDSLTSYQFPARYLGHFSGLSGGSYMLAIVYEPRGKPPRGRMAYVGWAVLDRYPRRDMSGSGDTYTVNFQEPMRSFERPVPREIEGDPIERWLHEYPRGRQRNSATKGRAVRGLATDEAEAILRLGMTNVTWDSEAGATRKDPPSLPISDTRFWRLVTRLERSTRFRQDVLMAYGNRCAVSGLSADGVEGLVEAAHIRAAGRPEFGPDHITNGIALTPTLHRLFDRHLFSFQYKGDELLIVLSKQLTVRMVEDPIIGSRLRLRRGQRVRLPLESTARPGRNFVEFHRRLLRP